MRDTVIMIVTSYLLIVSVPILRCLAADTGSESQQGSQDADEEFHWGYHDLNGPSHWSTASKFCVGHQQSPIDIITKDTKLDDQLDEIRLEASSDQTANSSEPSIRVSNNGHTVNLRAPFVVRVLGGKLSSSYRVIGVHFHWGFNDTEGSEHTIDGKQYPLEMHTVSFDEEHFGDVKEAIDKSDGLAVIGLLFEVSDTDNPLLTPLINALNEVNEPGKDADLNNFDLMKLYPSKLNDYYRYSGSLTTPPCFQSVIWTVLREVSTVSKSQLQSFRNLLEDSNSGIHMDLNWRPTQPLNGRTVYRSFVSQKVLLESSPNSAATMGSTIISAIILPILYIVLH